MCRAELQFVKVHEEDHEKLSAKMLAYANRPRTSFFIVPICNPCGGGLEPAL